MRKIKTGVIGAGAISDTYLTNFRDLFDNVELVSICARHLERAELKAQKYGLRACTLDGMLADKEIEMAVVLTPVDTHYEIIKRALEAGKHVYTEKTMTSSAAEALELEELAKEKGLLLGCAPDTFMGAGIQTARKAIDDGLIGEVNSFSISINRNNDLLTSYFPFLRLPGAGALRDYSVYYITALVALLGGVESVSAFVRAPYQKRKNVIPSSEEYGKEIVTPNESIVTAIMKLGSGVTGTIHEDNETVMDDRADFAVFGTKGVLLLGNPNNFGEPVKIIRSEGFGPAVTQTLEPLEGYSGNSRGLGAAQLAKVIAEGGNVAASSALACHVLDIIEAIEHSSMFGKIIKTFLSCERPEPFAGRL